MSAIAFKLAETLPAWLVGLLELPRALGEGEEVTAHHRTLVLRVVSG